MACRQFGAMTLTEPMLPMRGNETAWHPDKLCCHCYIVSKKNFKHQELKFIVVRITKYFYDEYANGNIVCKIVFKPQYVMDDIIR